MNIMYNNLREKVVEMVNKYPELVDAEEDVDDLYQRITDKVMKYLEIRVGRGFHIPIAGILNGAICHSKDPLERQGDEIYRCVACNQCDDMFHADSDDPIVHVIRYHSGF